MGCRDHDVGTAIHVGICNRGRNCAVGTREPASQPARRPQSSVFFLRVGTLAQHLDGSLVGAYHTA